ncbi:tRNA (5-methylaminomethyl-2-thiouridylate)-methyltransferase / FAD-dependent cmnm(5)s(2)U34 oxidoreductase [hydrothermal vent metagenome]|uniref:tRNA (5-methylaminomethyl-2-thiouridylate)-methyltransferase / FAD-dependent cmnm(5)s(2)U34 oxidoreductase n=1 Tax=hydrothermal vent metagenome TaxID=652676 RepID=A0A3B0VRN8_9ZZZZ
MSFEKLLTANVTWTDKCVPHSALFDDYYFSSDDGLAEVEHTFIQPNQLISRFSKSKMNKVFRIAETGFGSGLNFLVAVQHWLTHSLPDHQLHFMSFEKHPMRWTDIARVHQQYPQFKTLSNELKAQYPLLIAGWHDCWLCNNRVRLTLWFGDVLKGLPECDASSGSQVDAWILDGFTPSKNPDMWQPALYRQMARLSHKQTSFATFTAAGEVRRSLQAAGFKVQKASGYGKKREMCFGKIEQLRKHSLKAPWFCRPAPVKTGTAIVVGAGLAGASIAYQLAKAGWQVRVLEAQAEVATQASGNLAGTVHPLITADWNLRSQWYLQGFEAMLRLITPWLNHQELTGELHGIVQMLVTETSLKRVKKALIQVGLPTKLAVWLTREEVTQKLGTEATASGLFFPKGGWLNPTSVVKRCLQHHNITVQTNQIATDIIPPSNSDKKQLLWQVKTTSQLWQSNIVVLATGSLNETLNLTPELPIRPVKGQVSHLNSEQFHPPLNYPVTHSGYSSPCHGGAVSGATFEAPNMSEKISITGHQHNLNAANNALPNWVDATAKTVQGRVAFRPTTPDHLPIVGAIPDFKWMEQAYLTQSHTHVVYKYPKQRYQTGLYVSNGHGSRGLMSVFLAAESLLADIQGSALVQPLSLYHANHPARFAIRKWRSGK